MSAAIAKAKDRANVIAHLREALIIASAYRDGEEWSATIGHIENALVRLGQNVK